MQPSARFFRTTTSTLHQYRGISDSRPFVAGDRVILRTTSSRQPHQVLSKPLAPRKEIQTHKGVIRHEDVIGRRVRDVVKSSVKTGKGGTEYRLHEVRLEEYVRLTRRLVTPLYPQDAQLIVNLLDLHPDFSDSSTMDDEAKLEILEAGTGHGALTLYLSRAIHAANSPRPGPSNGDDAAGKIESNEKALADWENQRRAIIHTIEISPTNSAHAQEIVEGFRHGQYYHNVDFHTGNVGDWVTTKLAAGNEKPFLAHAFLDLPGSEKQLEVVSKALRVDGTLVVFNPSITQISDCLVEAKRLRLELELEKVIELGVNGGTGGREWDIRVVRPRALKKASALDGEEDAVIGTDMFMDEALEESAQVTDLKVVAAEQAWKMVCRPKVGGGYGELTVGGGFVGVFRKLRKA